MPTVTHMLAFMETPSDYMANTNIITTFPWLPASILVANLSGLVRCWRKKLIVITSSYCIILYYYKKTIIVVKCSYANHCDHWA